jgi:hypothetical protein
LKGASVLTRPSPRYEYPGQCALAPVLPGVLLLFSSDDVLVHVSATGNLREELISKGPHHHRTTRFACEVIFDHEWPSFSHRGACSRESEFLHCYRKGCDQMKFFIPAAEDAAQAEEVYQSIRRFVAEQEGRLTITRIYRIEFSHNGKQYNLAVGDRFQEVRGELVIAILEGRAYYVCTPHRGVVRGQPFLVSREFATHIEEFEPFTT